MKINSIFILIWERILSYRNNIDQEIFVWTSPFFHFHSAYVKLKSNLQINIQSISEFRFEVLQKSIIT